MPTLIAQHLSPGVNLWGPGLGVEVQICTEGIPPCVYSRWGSPPPHQPELWGCGAEGMGKKREEEERERSRRSRKRRSMKRLRRRSGRDTVRCVRSPPWPQEHPTPYIPQISGEGEFDPNILGGLWQGFFWKGVWNLQILESSPKYLSISLAGFLGGMGVCLKLAELQR